MDQQLTRDEVVGFLKKYRYTAVVLLIGIMLMCIPQKEKTILQEPVMETAPENTLQEELSRILSQVEGAGKVEVLLTLKQGEEILYQTDEQRSRSETNQSQDRQTVLVDAEDRQKTGLIRQINPPVFQGAIILSQGAASAEIRLALTDAVVGATGLPYSSITVLKMK